MNCFIQGASRGLGLAIVKQLLVNNHNVIATSRHGTDSQDLQALKEKHPESLQVFDMDVTNERDVKGLSDKLAGKCTRLDLVMNVAGLLHEDTIAPEKKLEHVEPFALHRVFSVNAFGPLLVAKHFGKFLTHGDRAVLANISARVGSIGDNRLGGWYSYRASKSAQNMFTRTVSIELGRKSKELVCVSLHPGTVETDLSEPFRTNVPVNKLFSPEASALKLLSVIHGLEPKDTGQFFDYAGKRIEW